MANGAVSTCTNHPPSAGPDISAMELLIPSRLFASSSRFRPTSAGTYDG